jgi:hypothetical protein
MEPNSELLLKLRQRRTRMGEEAAFVDVLTIADQDNAQGVDMPVDVKVKQRRILFEASENRSANRKEEPPMKLCKLEDTLGDLPGELDVAPDMSPRASPSPTPRMRYGDAPRSCSPASVCQSSTKKSPVQSVKKSPVQSAKNSPGHSTSPGAKREDSSPTAICLPSMELGRKVMEAICEESSGAEVSAKDMFRCASDAVAADESIEEKPVEDKDKGDTDDDNPNVDDSFQMEGKAIQLDMSFKKLDTSVNTSSNLDESGEAEPLEYAALDFFSQSA